MAAWPKRITVDAVRACRNVTIEVEVVQSEQMRIRFWVARQLIHLAAFVAGVGYEEIDNGRSG